MAPIGPKRLAMAPAVLLEATHQGPAIIPQALQQRLRGLPGVTEDGCWATVQAVTRLSEELQRQGRLGGSPLVP